MHKICAKRLAAIARSAAKKQPKYRHLFYAPDGGWLGATDGTVFYATRNHDELSGYQSGYFELEKSTLKPVEVLKYDQNVGLNRDRMMYCMATEKNAEQYTYKIELGKDLEITEDNRGFRKNKVFKIAAERLKIFANETWTCWVAEGQTKLVASNADKTAVFAMAGSWVDVPEFEPIPEPQPTPEPIPAPEPKPTPVPIPSDGEPLKKTAEPALKVVKYNHLAGVAKMETKWKATADRLMCKKCGHKLASETEWILAVDTPFLAHQPLGTRDSGTYICPNQECLEFQRTTVFDPYVTADEKSIKVELPYSAIRNVFASWQLDGGIFNVMTACFNAVKYKVLEQFNNDDDDHMRAILWPDLYYSEKDQLKIWAEEVDTAQKIIADMQQRKVVK